ncbi:MAG: hypothetical protein N4A63_16335 [Vallitalea sp.]|jgi:nitrogen regulatory protein PII-like uncharacterized protein|nr:hypothetical protein [Vallitalea sp.]
MIGKQIFEMAIDLINERSETGVIIDSDVKEYKNKTPTLLTIGQYELSRIADIYNTISYDAEISFNVNKLEDQLSIDDTAAVALLTPYLASQLIMDSDTDIAGFYNDKYEELKREFRQNKPAKEEPIKDMYGGI